MSKSLEFWRATFFIIMCFGYATLALKVDFFTYFGIVAIIGGAIGAAITGYPIMVIRPMIISLEKSFLKEKKR